MASMWHRSKLPLLVFAVGSGVYVTALGGLVDQPTADRHFIHLADSFLHGQLGVVGNEPLGYDDWACFDTVERGPCPRGRFRFPGQEDRYRWYISFPPFPALLVMPAVALFGTELWDRLFWALLGGLGPAMVYVLLRHLRESGRSGRSVREDLTLTTLFAFGTVYFFTAVQGEVWYVAHVVATPLICLYLLFGLGARRPLLAGLMLGLAFVTRASAAFLVVFFAVEALAASRAGAPPVPDGAWYLRLVQWLRGVRPAPLARSVAIFSAPILVIGALAMWMNASRFDSPFEFGHTYLQIHWRDRIERWGLINYHYFAKNFAVFMAALPWLSALPPYVKISRHGLALWFTTPQLWLVLFPRRKSGGGEGEDKQPAVHTLVALYAAVVVVGVVDLCYQNSGWVQFGYRFSLDYMPLLFALLAIGRRPFRAGFHLLLVFAIVVNLFGALTFRRAGEFYDDDRTQDVIFQPD